MAETRTLRFAAGEVLFRQGDVSTDLYHIQEGRVGISTPGTEKDFPLAELGPGSLVGEMALISGPPRTATATALEPVTVLVIPEAVFRKNLLGLPGWALSVAQVLADRLRNTTVSLDKLMYEKAHSAALPGRRPRAPTNIAPQGLSIYYYPDSDIHRLNLSGTLGEPELAELLARVDTLRGRKISPVILNFANVVNVHRRALETVVLLAQESDGTSGRVLLENVQLIAERFHKQKDIQQILQTSQTPVRRLDFQEILIRQGDLGDELYVVKSGVFSVYRTVEDQDVVLWSAREGDVLGEMALITGDVRTATVRAEMASEVFVLDVADFRKNTYHIPRWFMTVIEGLVTRLRDTNEKLDQFLADPPPPVPPGPESALKIYEDVGSPGTCLLAGDLTASQVETLNAYLLGHIRRGRREFRLDVSQVRAVDKKALRYLAGFHRSLADIRGRLEITGAPLAMAPRGEPGTEENSV